LRARFAYVSIRSMTGTSTIAGMSGMVATADLPRALAYYAKIGFATEFVHGDPPFYASVRRGRGRLALRHMDAPIHVGEVRAREEFLAAIFEVDTQAEIRALAEEFARVGASFHRGVTRQTWGALDLVLADPDGNLLLFAGPAD
jgi:catechol 2,3-dioxygenase-like lactoylglutathione lyase family enzyme